MFSSFKLQTLKQIHVKQKSITPSHLLRAFSHTRYHIQRNNLVRSVWIYLLPFSFHGSRLCICRPSSTRTIALSVIGSLFFSIDNLFGFYEIRSVNASHLTEYNQWFVFAWSRYIYFHVVYAKYSNFNFTRSN